jgi:hypothetical protein
VTPDVAVLAAWWGQWLSGLLIVAYVAVWLYWYMPRMARRTAGGLSYRLLLAGQNLALFGLVMTLQVLCMREGAATRPGPVMWGLLGGFCAGVAVLARHAASWDRQFATRRGGPPSMGAALGPGPACS